MKKKDKQPLMRVETKLTAVTMSVHGRKIQTFLMLPIINNKAILPAEIQKKMENDLGAERGDTITLG